MSFTTQVVQYAGASTGLTTEITQFLTDGVEVVISRIEPVNKSLLQLFATEVAINSGAAYALGAHDKILDVNRNGYRTIPVSHQHRDKLTDTDSLYFAHKTDPKYYVLNGTLIINPSPTATEIARVSFVTYGAINDAAETIASFPSEWYKAVVLYASKMLLQLKMSKNREATHSLSTELTKLTTYIDTDEDPELAAAKIGEINLLLSEGTQELQTLQSQYGLAEKEYETMFQVLASNQGQDNSAMIGVTR